jgi:2-(1,2-epoxy-1,2-dihydrophenyl)acetyl-CoA isomerase
LEQRVRDLQGRQDRSVLKLHTLPKPTVAIVNGYAIGAGFSLALACDIRLMGDEAKIGTGFGKLGVSGDNGGTFFLSRLVGTGIARELCFTAEIFDAARAQQLGIANHVFPQDRLMEDALAFCDRLAHGPTAAFARMKLNLNQAWTSTAKEALDSEAERMCLSTLSGDFREAVKAFVEKRDPRFGGR